MLESLPQPVIFAHRGASAHAPENTLAAFELAHEYGRTLHTGVFYRDPNPGPTYEAAVAERHQALVPKALPRARVLEAFIPRA